MHSYLSQNSEDIIISAPGILKNGTQATSLTISSFTVAIVDTDGTALANYTDPVITNPLSNGNYIFNFQSSANSKAFININSANPYNFTMDHPETDVEPWGPIPIRIKDNLFDIAKQSTLSSLDAKVVTDTTTVVNLTTITEAMPRIERLDTFQFIKSFGTVPNSVSVEIYLAPGDPSSNTVVATGTATQSGSTANYYYYHTDAGSNYTTVDSSGFHFIKWTAYRSTGNDIIKDYFEIIRTD